MEKPISSRTLQSRAFWGKITRVALGEQDFAYAFLTNTIDGRKYSELLGEQFSLEEWFNKLRQAVIDNYTSTYAEWLKRNIAGGRTDGKVKE